MFSSRNKTFGLALPFASAASAISCSSDPNEATSATAICDAPAYAQETAVALPTPLAAPVIKTVLPPRVEAVAEKIAGYVSPYIVDVQLIPSLAKDGILVVDMFRLGYIQMTGGYQIHDVDLVPAGFTYTFMIEAIEFGHCGVTNSWPRRQYALVALRCKLTNSHVIVHSDGSQWRALLKSLRWICTLTSIIKYHLYNGHGSRETR